MRFIYILSIGIFLSLHSLAKLPSQTIEEQVLKSIMLGEQNREISVSQNCLYESYLSFSHGNFKKTISNIKSCSICTEGINPVSRYYCQKLLSASYMWIGDYIYAHKEISDIFYYEKELAALGLDIDSLKAFETYLKYVKLSKKDKNTLSLTPTGEFLSGDLIVDTGSIFDTRRSDCVDPLISSNIYFLLNKFEESVICVSKKEQIPYINYTKNIMGLLNLSSYNRIIFDNAAPAVNSTKLYYDFETIFFLAKTEFSSESINACIDTGSLESSISFKYFRKHYEQFKSIETQIIKSGNSRTQFNIRGKIVKSLDIYIGESNYTFVEIPMFIDRTAWFHCDMIIGRDLISELFKEINFEKGIIYIK